MGKMSELEVMVKELRGYGENLLRNAGFTKEVKELLIKHGANKLSEINTAEYEALLAEVEVLGNG